MGNVSNCTLIDLPKISDTRGNLTYIEGQIHVPFEIKRIFYLYDVPLGSDRGGHALRKCHQVLIAITGSFDVLLDDGRQRKKIHLNQSSSGLHITPFVWREMDNFIAGTVCLVLASERYDPKDYCRTYDEYISAQFMNDRYVPHSILN